MDKYNFKGLKRISKKEARKQFDNNVDILFIPHKCDPTNNFYNMGVWINKSRLDFENSFDNIVNHYEFYNCNYNELGKYTAFYIKTN